jgi:hypothetical protein
MENQLVEIMVNQQISKELMPIAQPMFTDPYENRHVLAMACLDHFIQKDW